MAIDPVSLAITVALNAAAMAITASRKIEGPRLNDLSVTVADYGTPLPNFRGTRRIECVVFYAEPIKEVKKRRKTKMGKYSEYTYFGTWAWLVADHAIASINKIWFDTHLVYDPANNTNVFGLADDYEFTNSIRFYYGSETQEADERMLAYVESEEGEGLCPAYLGVSYIFFEDNPLEKLGNRFPVGGVEGSTTGGGDSLETSVLSKERDENIDLFAVLNEMRQSVDGRYGVWSRQGNFGGVHAAFDTEDPTYTLTESSAPQVNDAYENFVVIDTDGTIYYAYDPGLGDWRTESKANLGADAAVLMGSEGDLNNATLVGVAENSSGDKELIYREGSYPGQVTYHTRDVITAAITEVDPEVIVGTAQRDQWGVCIDRYGDAWTALVDNTGTIFDNYTACELLRIHDGGARTDLADQISVTGLPSGSPPILWNNVGGFAHIDGYFLIVWEDSNFALINEDTGAVVDTWDAEVELGAAMASIEYYQPLQDMIALDETYFWLRLSDGNIYKISLPDFSLLSTVDLSDILTPAEYSGGSWPVLTFNFLPNSLAFTTSGETTNSDQPTLEFITIAGGDVTLGSICELVSQQVGLDATDYDFTALDQTIPGYSWSQGAGKDILSPLLDLHDSDVRMSGFTIEGQKRGQSPTGAALNYEYFVRDNEILYELTNISETDLPRRVFLTFADTNADQQPNTAVFQRNANSVETNRELSIDLTTYAMTASDAQPLVERFLRRTWMMATQLKMALPITQLLLDPGDVKDILIEDGLSIRMKAVDITRKPNRSFETRWERESAAVQILAESEGAEFKGRIPPFDFNFVATQGFILDIPLIDDTQDQQSPFLLVAAGPAEAGSWTGADVAQSDTGDVDSFNSGWDGFGSSQYATWGDVNGTLPDALTSVVDEGTELSVTVYGNSELTSISDADFESNNSINLIAIGSNDNGWEILQFRDAILQSASGEQIKEYTLSGLRRGMRGTEQYVGTHGSGEMMILFDTSVKKHTIGASKIADTDYYDFATLGFIIDGYNVIALASTAAAQKPYSPVDITLERDEIDGAWQIRWTRRTRIGGNLVDGQDVPLGETDEQYKVRIMDGANPVRTIETEIEEAYYDSYDQITDWGGEQASLVVEIVQMSPALGIEGYPATASA